MRIAIAIFDGVEELDFVGPWEVLTYWALNVPRDPSRDQVEVFTVAASGAAVTSAKGLRVLPDRTWDELGVVDVLIFPGGHGTRPLMRDDALLKRIRGLAGAGVLMASVCTGALVYAAAGLLAGRPATTHWGALDELTAAEPTVDIRDRDRYVDDGDVVTAAGVSAGIDMALHLVVRLDSVEAARQVKRGIEYDPCPPV